MTPQVWMLNKQHKQIKHKPIEVKAKHGSNKKWNRHQLLYNLYGNKQDTNIIVLSV